MTKWEYQRLVWSGTPSLEQLNEMGARGWELCGRELLPGQVGIYEWLFKRQVPPQRVELETKAPSGTAPVVRTQQVTRGRPV